MTAAQLLKTKAKEIWQKIYNRIHWRDSPSTATALNETNLNRMDVAINDLDNRVIQLKAEKLDLDVANLMVATWVMDMNTYVITVTYLNGTVKTYDLNLERIPVNINLDEDTGIMTFTYADGSHDSVNIADLIKATAYEDSDTIAFTKTFNEEDDMYHVTAEIKNGSIEERHLNPDYRADIQGFSNVAQEAANDSLQYSKDSKRWAVGDSEYPGSEIDNSEYYYNQAKLAKEAAEQARDEAQATSGVVVMAPGVLGVGKPDNETIAAEEDGTIKSTVTASSLQALDTSGVLVDPGQSVSSQSLIDWISDQIVNQVLKKTELVNNALSTTAGVAALDSAMGKFFGDKINLLENSLSYGYCADMNSLFSPQYYNKICLFKFDGATTNRPVQMSYGDGYIISYCVLDWCVQHVYSVGTYDISDGVYKRVYDPRSGWGQWYSFSELRVVSNVHNPDIVYENYSFGYVKSGIGILNVDCYYRANAQYAEFKLLDTDFKPWQFAVESINDQGEHVQIIVRNDGSVNLYNRDGAIGENRVLRVQLILNS